MVFYPPVFLLEQERFALVNWIRTNIDASYFKDPRMGGDRLTTRMSQSDTFTFPVEAYTVQKRISELLGFSLESQPDFKDGMVASYAKPGDSCYEHMDPTWHDGLYTVHCNVILDSPDSGGDLIADGRSYAMPQGKFICYPVSELAHGTSLVTGSKARLMWVFGFCVTPECYGAAVGKFQ